MLRDVVAAVRAGGSGDPETNSALAQVIEKARKMSVPKARIINAIRIGLGEGSSGKATFIMEITGADGLGMLLETGGDNPRRSLPEIKRILTKGSLILSKEGSATWLFDKRGRYVLFISGKLSKS